MIAGAGRSAWAAGAVGRRSARLLWISLGLNAFLIALCVSRLLHGGMQPTDTAAPARSPIERLVGAMGVGDADRFRAVLDANRNAITPARAAVSAAQARLAAVIRRTPFDPPAVRAALLDWQENWQGFIAAMNTAVLAGLGDISEDGRVRFADASLADDARHVAAARAFLERGR